jgi:HSP20 family protein
MALGDLDLRMWAQACEMLARAERIQREAFRPRRGQVRLPVWEPPADVLETEGEVLVFLALPGVNPDEIEAAIEDGALVVVGHRILPRELRTAVIHRMELPQGRFERRLELPAGRYDQVRRFAAKGCLVISLRKM